MMSRKVIVALLGLVGLVACSGEVPEALVRIEIGLPGVKAGTVEGTFAETLPSGSVELVLEGEDGVRRSVRSGESAALAVGSYEVSGRYMPVADVSTGIGVSGEPSFVVSASVDVRNGVGSYLVPARWDCYALVMDGLEAKEYRCGEVAIPMDGSGRYSVAYVVDAADWVLGVVPVDSDVYEVTEFPIVAEEMQKGKWYMYKAGRIVQSGTMGFDWPEWEQGWNGDI